VLAVGDAEFQKKCLGKMGDVASNEGRTVLFVSHNMSAVQLLCNPTILITKGNVASFGLTSSVIDKYLKEKANGVSEICLSDRVDRSGQGQNKVIDIQVKNESYQTIHSINTGQPLIFEFSFKNEPKNIEFIFGIYDSYGIHIAGFVYDTHSSLDKVDTNIAQILICEISELTLPPGNYSINCNLTQNGILEDHIENAYQFQVHDGYLRGRLIKSGGRAKVLIPHKWITRN
jgi:lipopolysaccharide transport system ATP-binding protein